MPQRVLIQLPGFGRIIAHAEKVIDGVLILLPAQSIKGNCRTGSHARCTAFFDVRIKAGHKRRNLLLRRLLLLLGWHLAGIDLLDHLRPVMGVCAQFEITRELVDPQISLLLLGAMTADAVFLQEGVKRLGSADGVWQASADDEEGGEAENVTGHGVLINT